MTRCCCSRGPSSGLFTLVQFSTAKLVQASNYKRKMNDNTRIASWPHCLSKQTPCDWDDDLLVCLDTWGIISLRTVEKNGAISVDSNSQEQETNKKKTETLYYTGNSPVKSICLIWTENPVFSGPVAPAVCLCLSSDCSQQPAAQAADGNAALRRCDVVRDEVICLTPSKKHLYLNHPPFHSSRLKR